MHKSQEIYTQIKQISPKSLTEIDVLPLKEVLEDAEAVNKRIEDGTSQQDPGQNSKLEYINIFDELDTRHDKLADHQHKYIKDGIYLIFPKEFEIYTSSLDMCDKHHENLRKINSDFINIVNETISFEVNDQKILDRQKPVLQQWERSMREAEAAHKDIQDKILQKNEEARKSIEDMGDDKL